MLLTVLVALLSAAVFEDSLRVKVIEQDSKTGVVLLLLPMHNTEVSATHERPDRKDALPVGSFYRAKIVPGKLGTLRKNRLIVKTKDGPVVLRIHTIHFR